MNKIRLASRNSLLATWQAEHVRNLLLKHHPQLEVEIVFISTTGDRVQDKPLADIGGKGLFIKELEHALIENRADIAVHSMKDVPPDLPPSLTLAAMLTRADVRDALLSENYPSLKALPQGASIGTGSVRRAAQLLALRPDLKILPLRGNVDTRLRKLASGDYDAIILAAAGLTRLGLANKITEYLSTDVMLPSVGQGAIGIECQANNSELIELLQPLNCANTFLCVSAERDLVSHLKGNCHSPIGSYAQLSNDKLALQGLVASADGKQVLTYHNTAASDAAKKLSQLVGESLDDLGAKKILFPAM
jgi:hydroxymethylbilane synthase